MEEHNKNDEVLQDEIIRVDKPKGISSFDVIRILRKKLGIKKMGHAGTLDPLASGLMLIGVNKGTKKLRELIGLPKVYQVEMLIGKSTTTGDMEGEVVDDVPVDLIDENELHKVLLNIIGELELPVPAYSAIKVGGKRLYQYAREGKEVEVPTKKMVLYSIKILHEPKLIDKSDKQILSLEMNVGSGVYVRSVVEEIGRRIGYPATVSELRRVSIGDYKVEGAMNIEGELENFVSRVK